MPKKTSPSERISFPTDTSPAMSHPVSQPFGILSDKQMKLNVSNLIMKKFVDDKQANDQISRIESHVQKGLSDEDIARIFTDKKEINLKNGSYSWNNDDISLIRETFRLEVNGKTPFQYKMIQVPPNIQVQANQHKGNEAASYLEIVVNQHAKDGWEFYRIDSIGVNVKPGCLAALLGRKEDSYTYYVVSFRKSLI